MKAQAPGKLILSGEHAVVHGCPALVTAVSRHARVSVTPEAGNRIRFETPVGEAVFAPEQLRARLAAARARYAGFLAGTTPITEVAPRPLDFLALAWPLLDPAPAGVRVSIASTIPAGAGMGSSAAVSAALLQALAASAGAPLDADRCGALSLEMERFQHGRPSGVDSFVAVHGGVVRYIRSAPATRLDLPLPPLHLMHTGSPESTTGECVDSVRQRFGHDAPVWREFAGVCGAVEAALAGRDRAGLIDAIRRNHRLLVDLGVVPGPVAEWIGRIEAAGGAAKVCGAGSIRGSGGGIVWVVGRPPDGCPYDVFTVEGESHGLRLLG